MHRRFVLSTLAVALIIVAVSFSTVGLSTSLSTHISAGVVDKTPGDKFSVEISFKNTGGIEHTWSINIEFEGKLWSWKGQERNLTLRPGKSNLLVWNGTVPEHAQIDSIARLIVYYDGDFSSLQWWIHVVPKPELIITSATVR